MKEFQADAVTSTQALLPNSLEEFQDGQSLGHLQPGPSDHDKFDLLEDYEAETELDEDADDISDRDRVKVGKLPEADDSTFASKGPILDPMAEAPWEIVQPLRSLQDADRQMYLDDVDGSMRPTNILHANDFLEITVRELQKQVTEQIAEFENTWYLEQSQQEKNGKNPRDFLETDLEEEHRMEKRRKDFPEELRMQSEAEGAGMATSNFRSAANNVTSVGRSVQVDFLAFGSSDLSSLILVPISQNVRQYFHF